MNFSNQALSCECLHFFALHIDPGTLLCNLQQQVLALREDQRRQIAVGIFHQRLHPLQMGDARGKDMAAFIESRPQRVHQLGPLVNKPLAAAEQHRLRLLIRCLRGDKAHLRLARGDHDRLGVGRVIFLTLDEGTDILRGDQLDLVTQRLHLARPVAGAAASLKNDKTGRLPRHEGTELLARQLLAKPHLPARQRSVDLKNTLCQIHTNHRINHFAVLSASWL